MVAGIDRWLVRETPEVAKARDRAWLEAARAEGAWDGFAAGKREQLQRLIGAIDPRVSGAIQVVSEAGAESPAVLPGGYTVQRVRWPVFEGLAAEGALFLPEAPTTTVIAVPDADEVPEEFPLAHRLAEQGCIVVVPVLVDRRDTWSGNEVLGRWTNQPHREWIHRQAFELGRTLIGYEVQKILAALDALHSPVSKLSPEPTLPLPHGRVSIAGDGEGGLLALYAAAIDVRFGAALISGYFGSSRDALFEEPIYRNLFGFLRDFDDAKLAALIAPRRLVIERSFAPAPSGPPEPRPGRSGAAPGKIVTPSFADVRAEIAEIHELRSVSAIKVFNEAGPGARISLSSPETISAFLERPDIVFGDIGIPLPTAFDQRRRATILPEAVDQRQRATVRDLERFTQSLLHGCERDRDRGFWTKLNPGPDWEAIQRATRKRLWEEVIGRIVAPRLPLNPRSRVLFEKEKWVAHEVVLDVLPEVFAWGWLLVPRDLQPGERRPVVVCQHGLEGLPEDVVTTDPKNPAFAAYKGFAAQLADRGFVVYAPHNPYRGKDEFRILQRKANPIGLSLFSFILAQHEASNEWLASLPFVDSDRIGFYGLSYGGKTAMRVPALLDSYCL